MVGSHCSGEASTHKLTVIKEAYELALMASSKDDPFLLERKVFPALLLPQSNNFSSIRLA